MAFIIDMTLPKNANVSLALQGMIDEAEAYGQSHIEIDDATNDMYRWLRDMIVLAGGTCEIRAISCTHAYERATLQHGTWWFRKLEKKQPEPEAGPPETADATQDPLWGRDVRIFEIRGETDEEKDARSSLEMANAKARARRGCEGE